MVVRVTIDSTEPLDEVVRVLGAMYGVTLVVSESEPQSLPSPTPDLDAGTASPATEAETAAPSSTADATAETPSQAAVPETMKPRRKRPSPGGGRASRARKTVPNGAGNAQIRSWARENGYTVSERGRVPATIVAAYRDAHV
jgi:hypothetical protein